MAIRPASLHHHHRPDVEDAYSLSVNGIIKNIKNGVIAKIGIPVIVLKMVLPPFKQNSIAANGDKITGVSVLYS